MGGNNPGPSPVFHVDARRQGIRTEGGYFMARLFTVPRLFLISKREADRPRLTRTQPELLPPGVSARFLLENRLARTVCLGMVRLGRRPDRAIGHG
jgi:hypothetical protein